MPDYKKMYFRLAARVADTIEVLLQAQQECEEMYCADPSDIDSDGRQEAE